VDRTAYDGGRNIAVRFPASIKFVPFVTVSRPIAEPILHPVQGVTDFLSRT